MASTRLSCDERGEESGKVPRVWGSQENFRRRKTWAGAEEKGHEQKQREQTSENGKFVIKEWTTISKE